MKDNVDRLLQQWRAVRPDLEPAPMGIVGRVERAARLFERRLAENFARHGLQLWEFDILATLRRAGAPYELTAGQLSASSMRTAGAITNRIDRLVARGLVTREVDPANRRSTVITLTPSGRELVDDVVSHHLAHEERLLATLSPEQQGHLAELLRQLLVGLGDVPPGDGAD